MPVLTLCFVLLAAAPSTPTLEVQPKARAFTVETAAVDGAAVLKANDHVDLLWVMEVDKRLIATTLMQNVIVLANAAPAPGEPRQLSLLVIPEEAELLAVAKTGGHLVATLRNPTDPDLLAERGLVTVTSSLNAERLPLPPTKKEAR